MYARVNVWQGSIEETGLLLFDTRDQAIDSIVEEIHELVAGMGFSQDLADRVLAEIEENCKYSHMTYICEIDDDPTTGRIVYFVLEAEHINDRRGAERAMWDALHIDETGD